MIDDEPSSEAIWRHETVDPLGAAAIVTDEFKQGRVSIHYTMIVNDSLT